MYLGGMTWLPEAKSRVIADYNSIRHITDRKKFALEAIKMHDSDMLFSLRSGKSIDDIIGKSTLKRLCDLVDISK